MGTFLRGTEAQTRATEAMASVKFHTWIVDFYVGDPQGAIWAKMFWHKYLSMYVILILKSNSWIFYVANCEFCVAYCFAIQIKSFTGDHHFWGNKIFCSFYKHGRPLVQTTIEMELIKTLSLKYNSIQCLLMVSGYVLHHILSSSKLNSFFSHQLWRYRPICHPSPSSIAGWENRSSVLSSRQRYSSPIRKATRCSPKLTNS